MKFKVYEIPYEKYISDLKIETLNIIEITN